MCVLVTQRGTVPGLGVGGPVISVALLTGTERKGLLSEHVWCAALFIAFLGVNILFPYNSQ